MGWSCFDYCMWCRKEHQVFIPEEREPEWKSKYVYECRNAPTGVREFRYTLFGEPVSQIPPTAAIAQRLS